MKQEQMKLIIVFIVAIAAIIGLFVLMDVDFSPAMTGAVVAGSFSQELSLSSETLEISAEQPASAGCCNWDCDNYQWTSRTRSMDCSIGKPAFGCRK